MKIFVFALLKTVQNVAERNSGRILRLFNCNDRGFLLLQEAPQPKFLPGLVSPIKVWFERLPKKWPFCQLFFLVNIGQENVFYDIQERKNAFLGYKNNKFKNLQKLTFSHSFG